MASTSGTLSVSVDAKDSLPVSASRLKAYTIGVDPAVTITLTNGSGANQASKIFQESGTLVATTKDFDLTTLVCADGSVGFTNVRAIFPFNADATAGGSRVLLLGGATNAFEYFLSPSGAKLQIDPGWCVPLACPLKTAGWLVDSTHKVLRLDSGASTVPWKLVIFGN